MIAWRRRAAVSWLVILLAAAVPGVLTACSGSAAGQVDYIVDGALDTYNTNTVVRMQSDGTCTTVFDGATLSDNYELTHLAVAQ